MSHPGLGGLLPGTPGAQTSSPMKLPPWCRGPLAAQPPHPAAQGVSGQARPLFSSWRSLDPCPAPPGPSIPLPASFLDLLSARVTRAARAAPASHSESEQEALAGRSCGEKRGSWARFSPGLYFFALTMPVSTTYFIPVMVMEVSAMLVEMITLRQPWKEEETRR